MTEQEIKEREKALKKRERKVALDELIKESALLLNIEEKDVSLGYLADR